MQMIMKQDLIMDNSHNVILSNLPIPTGERFTVIVLRENTPPDPSLTRKVYAHRIPVESIDLPTRESLHER
jgi:hypothetical protein